MKITFASLSSSAILSIVLSTFASAHPQSPESANSLFKRATTPDGTCGNIESGNNHGYSCPTTYSKCCSKWGWCGDTIEYCGSGCQPGFGSCSGTTTTKTTSTTKTSTKTSSTSKTSSTTKTPTPTPTGRARPGSVPYGVEIYSCTVPGTVALTFDDGPYAYTNQLLTLLKNYNVKATFFINGQNWGDAITSDPSLAATIKSAYSAGHQIGSHTWSHPDLDTLSATSIKSQMTQLESALLSIIGVYPVYARAPYFNCGSTCLSVMNSLSYHLIHTNCDTNDWMYNTASTNYIAQDIFNGCVSSASGTTGKWIVLNHDVHATTVQMLAEYEIKRALALGYKLVTVGQCLGDPAANWYRTVM